METMQLQFETMSQINMSYDCMVNVSTSVVLTTWVVGVKLLPWLTDYTPLGQLLTGIILTASKYYYRFISS